MKIGNLGTDSAASAKKFFTNQVRLPPGISIKNLFHLRGFTSERNQLVSP
jgi:hypothetical protein